MHWPQATDPSIEKPGGGYHGKALLPTVSPTYIETWGAIEELLLDEAFKGQVKAIGVSNFSVKLLETLLATARIIPAANQVEAHPYRPQASLEKFCNDKGIHLTAYCR